MSAIADSVGYTDYAELKQRFNRLVSGYESLLEASMVMLKVQPTHQFLNGAQLEAGGKLQDQIENSENVLLSETD